MSKLHRALRSRRRLLTVWGLIVVLVGAFKTAQFCDRQPEGYCEMLAGNASFWGALFICGSALWLWLRHRKDVRPQPFPDFKNNPRQFDGEYIRITGKVIRVLDDPLREQWKRRFINWLRTLTKNPDFTGRYIHLRFILSSPQLRRGERILVLHNTDFEKVRVRRGSWVEVLGKYIHQPGLVRSIFGSPRESFYGRIHHTHKPMGTIQTLKRKPRNLKQSRVALVNYTASAS